MEGRIGVDRPACDEGTPGTHSLPYCVGVQRAVCCLPAPHPAACARVHAPLPAPLFFLPLRAGVAAHAKHRAADPAGYSKKQYDINQLGAAERGSAAALNFLSRLDLEADPSFERQLSINFGNAKRRRFDVPPGVHLLEETGTWIVDNTPGALKDAVGV